MAPNPDRDPAVEIALIRADLEAMQEDLKAVRKELKDLLEAWNTATGMVRFVKWLSTFATALAVLYPDQAPGQQHFIAFQIVEVAATGIAHMRPGDNVTGDDRAGIIARPVRRRSGRPGRCLPPPVPR